MAKLSINPIAHLSKYELRYLAEHMEASGQADELHRLLALETSDLRNAWYEAKVEARESEGYLRDVQRAWRLAKGQFVEQRLPRAIGLQCRYALIVTSINSLSRSISPDLAVELVAGGVWTPEQGLAHAARQAPDSAQRPKILRGLSFYLSEAQLREALILVQEVEYEYVQAQGIAQAASRMADQGNVEGALNEIQKIKNPDHRGWALAELAPSLPESLLPTALAAVDNIEDSTPRSRGLTALVVRLATQGHPEQALAEAMKHGSPADQMSALENLASYLPAALQERALKEAEFARQRVGDDAPYVPTPAIANAEARAEALAALAVRFAQLGHAELALAEAQKVYRASNWAKAVDALAPFLSVELLHQALTIAESYQEDDHEWDFALRSLITCLAEAGYPEQALSETDKISRPSYRRRVLGDLAPYLSGALLSRALAGVQGGQPMDFETALALEDLVVRFAELGHSEQVSAIIQGIDGYYRAEVLKALESRASHAAPPGAVARMLAQRSEHFKPPVDPGSCQTPVELRAALTQEQQIGDAEYRTIALTHLATHLPETFAQTCATQIQTIKDTHLRDRLSTGLARRLAGLGQVDTALTLVQAIESETSRAETLAGIVQLLITAVGPQQTLAIGKGLDAFDRAQWLLSLGPRMPKEECNLVLTEALAAARRIEKKWEQDEVFSKLAPQLAASGRAKQALEVAGGIESEFGRADALVAIAPYLPQTLLRAAMAMALELPKERKSDAVIALAARLSLSQLRESAMAMLETKHIQDNSNMALLAPFLDQDLVQTALARLRELMFPGEKGVVALVGLLARLAALGYPDQALALFRDYEEGRFFTGVRGGLASDAKQIRVELLTRVVPHLPEASRDGLLREALENARQIPDEYFRVPALIALIPFLKGSQRVEIMRETLTAIEARGGANRESALVELLPQLPESLLREMLVAARRSGAWNYSLRALAKCVVELPKAIQGEVLQTALIASLLNKPFDYDMASTEYNLGHLAHCLASFSPAVLEPLWQDVLTRLTAETRQRLLATVGSLSPVLVALGGEEAATEAYRAIQDVSRWWP